MQCAIKMWSLFVLFIQQCILSTVGIGLKSSFSVRKNRRITTEAYAETVTHSYVVCAALCLSSMICAAANYKPDTRKCYLISRIGSHDEDASEWSYLSRSVIAQRTFHHISNQTTTWKNAKSYCESVGGGLANILSPTDHEMIWNIISQSQENTAWIGGSDIDSEGDYIWTNGCKFNDQNFNFWSAGNPDNWNGNENCLELWNLKWNDLHCDVSLTFVCEIDVP